MTNLLLFGIAFATLHISISGVQDFCDLPKNEGEGMGFIFSLFYDPASDSCQPFVYKGQGGNKNRFQNEKDCIRNCSARAEEVYPMEESQACHFPKAKGNCSGNFLMYYYDSIHDKCKKFFWSGCIGNGNRFQDQASCNATCAGIHDDGDEEEEYEPDTPVALICGIVFGLTGAIIIIVVVVLTVHSKDKAKKEPKKIKEKQTETPLQDQGIEMT